MALTQQHRNLSVEAVAFLRPLLILSEEGPPLHLDGDLQCGWESSVTAKPCLLL